MLDIKKNQSLNDAQVEGILKELEVKQAVSKTGKPYTSYTAIIGVDQELNGVPVENDIQIRGFAMKEKADGSPNKAYDNIQSFSSNLISAASAETPDQISYVRIGLGRIEENSYFDSKNNKLRSGFQVSSNYLNKITKEKCEPQATFKLTGVIVSITEEVDKDDEATGRLRVKLAVVAYNGKINIIEIIADTPSKVNYIQSNWNKGDTVQANGIINVSFKVVVKEIPQGFGESIFEKKTINVRELILTSGSAEGLDEALSYDVDDIKVGMAERAERLEALKTATPKKSVKTVPSFEEY